MQSGYAERRRPGVPVQCRAPAARLVRCAPVSRRIECSAPAAVLASPVAAQDRAGGRYRVALNAERRQPTAARLERVALLNAGGLARYRVALPSA